MTSKTKRASLELTEKEIDLLKSIANSRTFPKREIERAQILLFYHQRIEITEISRRVGIQRPAIYKCIDKALAMGFESALKDFPHSPKKPEITLEAKAWVTTLACTKPKDLGLSAEVWSRQSLANYVREHAENKGHPSLKLCAKATIQRILDEKKLQPHKIKYYLEKRDPEFDTKMKEILLVYQEVNLINEKRTQEKPEVTQNIITICVDEKPGVQAIANTAPDLPPDPLKYKTFARDHEYVRHGTASILAGIDLHDGYVFAQVHHRHRSCEFIELLKEIDERYPADKKIRLILDNHSAHISKETMAYLAKNPGRFIYVHTPTHGSWLNLAETLFGKMARTFLRHIRVKSWDELKTRILLGVAEFNKNPVVHKWTKFSALEQNIA
ncbi:MAG: IS630 family transposase [Chlamydiota bacterium]